MLLASCSTKKFKNITYTTSDQNRPLQLNVFVPRKAKSDKLPVLLYVHGGNWNSGNKNIYGFFGRNFAKKGVITVIPNYTLSPNANYNQMANEIAAAIKWTAIEIERFGGNPKNLFVTGHSAGGHLVALATMNPKYGVVSETVSGIILNDAAGLDMEYYLKQVPPTAENNYLTTWTNDSNEWKNASPIYFINEKTLPFMMYVGKKTYNSIKVGNERFLKELLKYQKDVTLILLNKKHAPMILQYFWPWNDRIDETIDFINKVNE
jgi:acetyl esterase/lipase